jgi:type VI secretion system protein ImpB
MPPKSSSQKFIARNRPPRVQIEYEVEIYGAQKKVELPFVMGVMADLTGKGPKDLLEVKLPEEMSDTERAAFEEAHAKLPPEERERKEQLFKEKRGFLATSNKFLEIDAENFDARLKATRPRVSFQVPNTLTGEGNLSVDLTFENMEDFSPDAVARKVEALNKLLTARNQLANLLTYMDGKSNAEELIAKALQDPALLQTLASAPKPGAEAPK